MHGRYETIDGRAVLRFERELDHPVDAVWRAVTEPDELAHWFPTAVESDLRVGGRIVFTFPGGKLPPMAGEIIELDPPRWIVFTWGEDRLSIEIEPRSGGARSMLNFSVLLDGPDKAARDAAGWHGCLDKLADRLAGTRTTQAGTEPADDWRERYDEYVRRGLPASAPLPGSADPQQRVTRSR